jgi:hypothetical protein
MQVSQVTTRRASGLAGVGPPTKQPQMANTLQRAGLTRQNSIKRGDRSSLQLHGTYRVTVSTDQLSHRTRIVTTCLPYHDRLLTDRCNDTLDSGVPVVPARRAKIRVHIAVVQARHQCGRSRRRLPNPSFGGEG